MKKLTCLIGPQSKSVSTIYSINSAQFVTNTDEVYSGEHKREARDS